MHCTRFCTYRYIQVGGSAVVNYSWMHQTTIHSRKPMQCLVIVIYLATQLTILEAGNVSVNACCLGSS